MAKIKKKVLTPERIAHNKFLKKMGVTKQQLKERKLERGDDERQTSFRPNSIYDVRKAYEE